MSKNDAPKSVKGDYRIYIHGNEITLVDDKNNITVKANCHPDDEFDIGIGIKEAFNKLNVKRKEMKIEVGDLVKIVLPGFSYATLGTDFFNHYGIMNFAVPYRFGVVPRKNTVGRVKSIFNGKYNKFYVVQVDVDNGHGDAEFDNLTCFDTVYIVGEGALKKVVESNV